MTPDQLLAVLLALGFFTAFILGWIVGVLCHAYAHGCPEWKDPNGAKCRERGAD